MQMSNGVSLSSFGYRIGSTDRVAKHSLLRENDMLSLFLVHVISAKCTAEYHLSSFSPVQ